MTRRLSFAAFGSLTLVLTALSVACGRPGDSLVLTGNDGTPATGGTPGTGGATLTGGSSATGGLGGETGNTGGDSNTGGSSATGGASGTGGDGTGGVIISGPPTIILLIERSLSMADGWQRGSSTTSRWELVKEALFGADGPVAAHEADAFMGLVGFTATEASCPNADVDELAAAEDNAEELAAAFAATSPQEAPKGESSVGEAVDHARSLFTGVTGKRNILLVTDGEPDTCAVKDPQCGHDAAIAAIQAAKSEGITVTVVGVGDENPTWYLQAIANAGAGQNVAELTDDAYVSLCDAIITPTAAYDTSGGAAQYYQPSSESELRGAFEAAFDAILAP